MSDNRLAEAVSEYLKWVDAEHGHGAQQADLARDNQESTLEDLRAVLATQKISENMQSWTRSVLDAEGLTDWTVKSGEAYCWIDDRVITFDFERYIGDSALFLHEVAHALLPRPEGPLLNHYHGGEWAAVYGRLVNRYMIPREV